MILNIPPASEIRTIITQKSAIKTGIDAAPNPELARKVLYNVLSVILEHMERVKNDPQFIGSSVNVSIDNALMSRPFFTKVTDYLTSLGYTTNVNLGTEILTISW
jgi:hypothetical protein